MFSTKLLSNHRKFHLFCGIKKSFKNCSTIRNFSSMNTIQSLYPHDGKDLNSSAVNSKEKSLNEKPMESVEKIPDDVWISNAKRQDFLAYFPSIVNEVSVKTAMMDNLGKGGHIARIMEYFMPTNVLYNGIATAESYKILAPKAKQTPKDIKLANYLGWCFEMLGDSCNIVDDIMDRSETRRNQPCWHNVDGIGLSAINDALLLETSAFYILKKHFGKLDCFLQLLDIFHDLFFSGQLGQQADARSAQNVNNFTVENFESIAMNLITNFTGYIPVALAMTLAGYPNLEPLQEARAIHKDLGLFYIVQNDYMDCFGDPEVTGKVGTDIQEGKCRWLSFACMEIATPEQKAIMRAHYGKDSAESVAIIKQLYIDLNLPKIYDEYTTKIHERLMMNIANLSDEGLRKVFLKFAETIYYAKNMNLPLFK